MKTRLCLGLMLLLAISAWAADPYLLHDLPLGSTLEQAQAVVPNLARAELPAPMEAWKSPGPVGEARDVRLLFREGKLVSISFGTSPGSFAKVRAALVDVLGEYEPAEDGRLVYEARRGTKRLQLFKRDDDSAWVVLLDLSQVAPEANPE